MLKWMYRYKKIIGPMMIIILISAAIRSYIAVQVPVIIRETLNQWSFLKPTNDNLVVFAILLFTLVLLRIFANYINISFGKKLEAKLTKVMRFEAVKHIHRLPLSTHDRECLGNLLSRAVSDVENFTAVIYEAPNAILSSVLMLGGSLFVMFRIHVGVTLLVVVIVPFYVVLNRLLGPKVRTSQYGIRKQYSSILSLVENSFSSIRLIKVFNHYDYIEKRLDGVLDKHKDAVAKQGVFVGAYKSGFLFLRECMRILVVCFGGYQFAIGHIPIGDLVAFQLLTMSFLRPIDGLLSIMPNILKALGSFDRYKEVMDMKSEKYMRKYIDKKILSGRITFERLNFRYENVPYKQVIKELSLEVNPGEKIGFAGKTGSGKSTILSLLMRLYPVEDQSILIDGMDINKLPLDSIREYFGLVQQDVTIMEGTIRENLLIAKPTASEREMKEALNNAEALDFVEELEMGLDSDIGQKGIMLSGGQRQRLSLARIFLKDPKVLLLDEATSSLDNTTERSLKKAFERLLHSRTAIIVAHRLSMVKHCDRIYIMEQGQIVEMGDHESLLAKDGVYKELYGKD